MDVDHVQNVAQCQAAVQDLHKDDVQREVIAAPNNNIDTRPKKEIPPEMVDIEF
jgi:hypothetical protein